MPEDAMDSTEELRAAAAAVTPDVKRVVLALATCRAALDEFHSLEGDAEWHPGAEIHSTAPGEYVLWVIAYGQLLSLLGQDTLIGHGIAAVLGANQPTGAVVANVALASAPTD